MSETFQKKCAEIKNKFAALSTEERYHLLMEMGRKLPPFPEDFKTPDRIVSGCQSVLYLNTSIIEGKLFFDAHTDALISAGLAALLISVYSGQSAESILKNPPSFITELGLDASLSPSRSNGLAQIHLRMKQEALKALVSLNR
ncbi:MAG: SufE [Chlamydiae bacterium CG10_big_fil_rev_8_21_14_0_10_42_34]|nr:MAG: SufE [Chlamydiae bacterium CG10_big_fil_rev_8_21_14_0_10_42_34]